jgi:hypothetical protein
MAKTLLPFALYEELEKIESLNPDEMRNFLSSLQKYCESTGKDFSKVCTDIGLEAPSWAGKLTHKQNVLLNSLISRDYYSEEDEGTSWSINPETERLDVIGKFKISSANSETNCKGCSCLLLIKSSIKTIFPSCMALGIRYAASSGKS